MDEKFTNKLKDILNDPPDFPFEEKAWENMENRLYGQPKSKGALLYYLIPLAILLWLLPVLFSWFAYQKLDKATAKIDTLETQLHSKNTQLYDTIVNRHITVVYDTIFKKTYITEKITNTLANQSKPYFNYPLFSKNNSLNSSPLNSNRPSYFQSINSPFSFYENQNNNEINKNDLANTQPVNRTDLSYLSTLNIEPLKYGEMPDLLLNNSFYSPAKKKKNVRYYLNKMQPTNFALSTNYSFVMLPGFGLNAMGDLSTGLEAEIGYGKNWTMSVGAEYFQWKFKKEFESDEDDFREIFKDFPEPQPDAPSDKLHELKGRFNYVQTPVGFKYYFSNEKQLQPSIGFGISARRALRSNLTYEYTSQTTGEYHISSDNLLPNSFELKSLWGSFGMQYALNDHWRLQLEGIGQFDLDGTYKYEKLKMLKVRGGVKYKF